ncbi:MAG: DUF2191 domain-containing protein [Cyclobacteriaceae bacterium]|nr:DUF2191 domain-containing protein [Cyclobacteriaceae bacterium]
MKVTALIPDELVEDVKKLSGGKNITESLMIALKFYVQSKNMENLIEEVHRNPLEFIDGFTAEGVRKLNRNR